VRRQPISTTTNHKKISLSASRNHEVELKKHTILTITVRTSLEPINALALTGLAEPRTKNQELGTFFFPTSNSNQNSFLYPYFYPKNISLTALRNPKFKIQNPKFLLSLNKLPIHHFLLCLQPNNIHCIHVRRHINIKGEVFAIGRGVMGKH